MLAGGLPPLGDRPCGSRVWCGSLPVGEARPPLGDRPRGSRKGQYPLTPLRARWARGCSGDMKVGRGFTAVARRVLRLAGLVRLPAGWQG